VIQVAQADDGFSLTLSDDSRVPASRVVLATGLHEFPTRPRPFNALSPTVASHTSDQIDMDRFAGQRVVVIGAGQSAIESAVLAHEAGARVRVVARASDVHWLTRRARIQGLSVLGRMAYAPSDVGPAGLSWVVAAPGMMRFVPERMRSTIADRCLIPAAAAWLWPRAEEVTISAGRFVTDAVDTGVGARLRLDDGEIIEADHVLLGTGFAPDLSSVSILSSGLREAVQRRGGYPVLRRGFETSVPGLHAVGALATGSFGPLMRFVSGTWYSAPALARTVSRLSHVSRATRPVESTALTASTENAVERAA
jgi:thioredoxin reductase